MIDMPNLLNRIVNHKQPLSSAMTNIYNIIEHTIIRTKLPHTTPMKNTNIVNNISFTHAQPSMLSHQLPTSGIHISHTKLNEQAK